MGDENSLAPPCLGETPGRGTVETIRFSWFGCEHSVHARFFRAINLTIVLNTVSGLWQALPRPPASVTYEKIANKKGEIWLIPGYFYDFLAKRAFVNLSINPSFAAPSPSSL